MKVKAGLRFARVGPIKARMVADAIRGKSINDALERLSCVEKKSSNIIKKLLNSAVANAEQKQAIDVDNLFIKTITVDGGPVYKRTLPRAQGRASLIRKRTSHIKIVLDEK